MGVARLGLAALVVLQLLATGRPAAAVSVRVPPYADYVPDLRIDWHSGNGYCGENSVAQLALYKGVWASQAQMRTLAHGEMMMETGAMARVTHLLGFEQTSSMLWGDSEWALYKNDTAFPCHERFMLWTKEWLIKGYGVVAAFRTIYHTRPAEYRSNDHYMPFVGIDYERTGVVDPADVFFIDNVYGQQIVRRYDTPSFFARWLWEGYSGSKYKLDPALYPTLPGWNASCRFDDDVLAPPEGGCVVAGYANYGVVVGDLPPIYQPSYVVITGWVGSTWPANQEPGEPLAQWQEFYTSDAHWYVNDTLWQTMLRRPEGPAKGQYRLVISRLLTGATYTTYKIGKLFFTAGNIPTSLAGLRSGCSKAGAACTTRVFTAPGPTVMLTHAELGTFDSSSITYWLTVRTA